MTISYTQLNEKTTLQAVKVQIKGRATWLGDGQAKAEYEKVRCEWTVMNTTFRRSSITDGFAKYGGCMHMDTLNMSILLQNLCYPSI